MPLLEARSISKAFPGVQALTEVDLRLEARRECWPSSARTAPARAR